MTRLDKAKILLSRIILDGFSKRGKHPVKRHIASKDGKSYTQTFWVKDKMNQPVKRGSSAEESNDLGKLLRANPKKPPSKEIVKEEKIKRIVSSTGVNEQRARRMMISIEEFTASGGQKIRSAEKEGGDYYVTDEMDEDEEINVVEEINDFLDLSPKYKGRIFRGLTIGKDEFKNFQEEAQSGFVSNAMSSYSSNLSVAGGAALKAITSQIPVIYSIEENKTGVDIQHLSTMPDEEEILQPAGARLKAIRIEKLDYTDPGSSKPRNVYIFHLEEIEPDLQQERRNQMREDQQ